MTTEHAHEAAKKTLDTDEIFTSKVELNLIGRVGDAHSADLGRDDDDEKRRVSRFSTTSSIWKAQSWIKKILFIQDFPAWRGYRRHKRRCSCSAAKSGTYLRSVVM